MTVERKVINDNQLHFFNCGIAERIGLKEAVVFQTIVYWVESNRMNDINFHDGFYWTYNTVDKFAQHYTYLTEHQVKRALLTLKEEGLIQTANYNKIKMDHTLWYALTDKGYAWANGMFDYSEEDINTIIECETTEDNTNSEINDMCKDMETALDRKLQVSERLIIKEWHEKKISNEIIIKAIEDNEYRDDKLTLKHVNNTIIEWKTKGLTTINDINAYCNDKHVENLNQYYDEHGIDTEKRKSIPEAESIKEWRDDLKNAISNSDVRTFLDILSVMPKEYYNSCDKEIVDFAYSQWGRYSKNETLSKFLKLTKKCS